MTFVRLTDLFNAAAERDPDGEALVGLTARMTWEELAGASTAVARTLIDDGIQCGDRVAIACLKDVQSTVAVHAILRAGGIVVPVDPMAPTAAARAVLADAAVAAVIGDARTLDPLDVWSIPEVDLRSVMIAGDTDDHRAHSWDDALTNTSAVAMPDIDPGDASYIIYTSGSTGRPKGIVHSHRSALAYAERAVASHKLTSDDRVAGISPLHFDQSTFELYAAPMAGAAVVIMGEVHARFPASLVQRTEAEMVTVWYSVPSLFRQLAERGGMDQRDLTALRLVLYGGEVYPGGALRELQDLIPAAQITNVYGPAEVNECTNHPIALSMDVDTETPIGRPWPDVEICVVDDGGEVVEPGSPGELWVSAPTMMSGYWRQPHLTAASVTERADGPPWYATGDVVVEDDQGVLWFRGRRDNQIKLRGVRLELEAVEAVVADAPGVAEAVVGPDDEGTSLEAVIIARDGVAVDPDAIRAYCVQRLAQVAVPRVVHERHDLPRTPSGKIDRALVRQTLRTEAESTND